VFRRSVYSVHAFLEIPNTAFAGFLSLLFRGVFGTGICCLRGLGLTLRAAKAARSADKDKGRNGMCDRCVELDKKIEHFHRLAARFTDQALLNGIRELIERAEVEKAALHPEQAA
jgi:hypothetical protein